MCPPTVIPTERPHPTFIPIERPHPTVIPTERSEWRNLTDPAVTSSGSEGDTHLLLGFVLFF